MATKNAWGAGLTKEQLVKNEANINKKKRFERHYIRYLDASIPTFVPKEGENSLRIVQPLEWAMLQDYKFEVYFHRSVGLARAYYLCLEKMETTVKNQLWMEAKAKKLHNIPQTFKGCFECQKQTPELWEADFDLAKTYYPDDRWLLWVLDLKDMPEKLRLWSAPRSLMKMFIAASRKRGTSVYRDPSDPKTGGVMYFNREGTGKEGTNYLNAEYDEKASPLTQKIAKQRKLFLDCIIVPTYEEVKATSVGTSDDEAEYDSDAGGSEPDNEGFAEDNVDLGKLSRKELKELLPNEGKKDPDNPDSFVVFRKTTDDEIREHLLEFVLKPEPEDENDDLDKLSRKELKELLPNEGKKDPDNPDSFVVFRKTTDDEIRGELRSLLAEVDEPDEDEPEPEDEPDENDDLGKLSRKELKELLPNGGKKDELNPDSFVVMKKTTDDEIREYLRASLEDEPEEEEEEDEPEEDEPDDDEPDDDEPEKGSVSAQKKQIRAQLKKQLEQKGK